MRAKIYLLLLIIGKFKPLSLSVHTRKETAKKGKKGNKNKYFFVKLSLGETTLWFS